MNVLGLFENKNIEDIKLGLQVIKCLGAEKEFEDYFKATIDNYQKVFNTFLKQKYKPNKFLYLKCDAHIVCKSLKSEFDTIKIGCSLLQNNHTLFSFDNNGIRVDLTNHYTFFYEVSNKRMDVTEIVGTINNYFNK